MNRIKISFGIRKMEIIQRMKDIERKAETGFYLSDVSLN